MIIAVSAFIAGLLSFLSPCVLPLIPSYLSFLMDPGLLKQPWSPAIRTTLLKRSLGFITGFSIVFIALSVVITLGVSFIPQQALNIISGALIILFALHILFNILPFLNYERRRALYQSNSFFTSLALGGAFSAGWSPCIGPLLASILLLAAQEGSLVWSIILLAVYSLGFAVPFFLCSFFYPTMKTILRKSTAYIRIFKITSGIILLTLGLSMLLGRLRFLNGFLFRSSQRIASFYTQFQPIISSIISICYFFVIIYVLRIKRIDFWIKIGITALLTSGIVLEIFFELSIIQFIVWYLQFQGI